jgi:thiol-disulfide isomerase/thioredoxin
MNCVGVALLILFAGTACQEKPAHLPQPQKPANSVQESGATKPAEIEASHYPDVVQKDFRNELCAKNDYRGKAAPTFKVEQWITTKEAPSREGKTVLIDYWATWCPPCRALIPELNEWQGKFKDDLVVIGISDEDPAKLAEFVKTTKMNYAMGTDPRKSMEGALGVMAIPHCLVISSDGVVRWQGFPGALKDPLTEAKLKQIIDADKEIRAKKDKGASQSWNSEERQRRRTGS